MATRSKLAVILHADVVGSTALVQKDERAAHERVREAFSQLSETIVRYGGTAHEVRGDALVAEFNRASDAVTASLAFQAANHATNQTLPGEIRPELRIGIALGEVIIADRTVTGAGVVLAQRLEQVTQPGGVCVQSSVRESVPSRFPFDYESRGEQSLKGFDEPVEPFFVRLRECEALPAPEMDTLPVAPTEPARPRRAVLVIGAMLLLSAGVASWWQPWTRAPEETASNPALERSTEHRTDAAVLQAEDTTNASRLSIPDKPSIAVLAFTNMSADPDQDFFAEGIAEDIITDLSKISGLFVIARNSSFSYKGQNISVKAIARELGVRYVLEGSVRRAGNTLRITAQLVDASTEGHLWADRYDGSLSDVFGLQDAVTGNIVEALSVALSPREQANLVTKYPVSPTAYEAFLRGKKHLEMRGYGHLEADLKAREAFQIAIDTNPTYALAYAGLGWTYWNDFAVHSYGAHAEKSLRAFELAETSLKLEANALAYRLRAKGSFAPDWWSYWGGSNRPTDFDSALADLRAAMRIEPGNADAMAELAYTLVFAGELQEAARLMLTAKRLNPSHPAWYHRPSGIANYLSKNYQEAIEDFSRWYQSEPIPSESISWFAAAHAQAGNDERAYQIIAELIGKIGGATELPFLQGFRYWYRFRRERDQELYLDGLRKAGIRDAEE